MSLQMNGQFPSHSNPLSAERSSIQLKTYFFLFFFLFFISKRKLRSASVHSMSPCNLSIQRYESKRKFIDALNAIRSQPFSTMQTAILRFRGIPCAYLSNSVTYGLRPFSLFVRCTHNRLAAAVAAVAAVAR